MYVIKVKKLKNEAIMPIKAHANDAGYDLFAANDLTILPGESALVGTGIALELPRATEAQLRPRSGLALKHMITLLNSPGTIDEDYRGELKVIMINHGKATFEVKKGMKIAQMVIAAVLETSLQQVESLNDSIRGVKGFGSTGMGKAISQEM